MSSEGSHRIGGWNLSPSSVNMLLGALEQVTQLLWAPGPTTFFCGSISIFGFSGLCCSSKRRTQFSAHQQHATVLMSLLSTPALPISIFVMLAHPVGVQWHLAVASQRFSLITREAEPFLIVPGHLSFFFFCCLCTSLAHISIFSPLSMDDLS